MLYWVSDFTDHIKYPLETERDAQLLKEILEKQGHEVETWEWDGFPERAF